MAEAPRVALLARPGTACDNLQAALRQAGAEVVHVGDPTSGDAAALADAAPQAVLVALEPAVEPALDAYDAVLQDPSRIVIYDEAELAAAREGWEAARWARHLAAKLAGHADVLPPGREPDDGPLAEEPVKDAAWAGMGLVDFEAAADVEPEPAPLPHMDIADAPDATAAQDALGTPDAIAPPETPGTPAAAETRAVTLEYTGAGDGGMLSLVDDDEAPAPEAAPEFAPAPAPAPELEPAGSRVPGAAVVLAGIGGPDAVRQFLGGLPQGFPRPVLVRQRLDGGRHDRLVRQLQRATPLPVELAAAGLALVPGHVYIVPDGIAAEADGAGSRFVDVDGEIGPLAGLPADDSAIVVLSGADPAQVDAVMSLAGAGALVAAQSAEECFDNAAPAAAIALGADSGSPSQLAGRVAGRWTA